jgi:hypothetical protein
MTVPSSHADLLFCMFDNMLDALESELRDALNTAVTGLVATARTRLQGAVAEVAKERAKGLAEVAEERAKGLAEVDSRRADFYREVAAMQMHEEKQDGRVELNIGGYRFETSVQTLRRVPHTFFDAYFSGRYAQDVCNDGSIFVDRDGEHFGHVLEYMRDGVVSVAELGARPSVSLLRTLKREFGFYCIELVAEQAAAPELSEMAYAIGGFGGSGNLSSMERCDAASGQWSLVAAMGTARYLFGACALDGDLYVTGGTSDNESFLSNVEKYAPLTNTWSEVVPLPVARVDHAAVTVGSDMYVLGGLTHAGVIASVLRFDSILGTYNQVAPMPVAGFAMASCAVGSDIYLFGGTGGDNSSTSVVKFDTRASLWSTLTPMPVSSPYSSATILDGLVYIVGAGDGSEVMSFNPTSEVWMTLTPTLKGRMGGASFVLEGCLYMSGGINDSCNLSVERYNVASNTWTAVADMHERRGFHAIITIGSAGPAEEQDLFDLLIAKAATERP